MTAITCHECHAVLPADARFCLRCGTPVAAGGEGERRIASVLFADVVGSTSVAVASDPEDLRAQLSSFFDACRTVIEEYGGRVEKFIGDAVMAVFGVPKAFGDDADRAVAAGLRLVDAVLVPIRVGVNTGEVVAVPADRNESLSVTGEAVHAAARLQSAAAPGQVLIGERTAHALRVVAARPLGAIPLKGFPEPVPVFEAVASTDEADEPAPFVGRDLEMELLELTHDRSRRGSAAHLAVVIGDPGTGKTRLVRHYLDLARATRPDERTVYLPNSPVRDAGSGTAQRLVEDLLDVEAPLGDLESEIARRLDRLVPTRAAEVARWVAASAGAEVTGVPQGPVDQQVLDAWVRLMRAVATNAPLTVVVDDAQWADPTIMTALSRMLSVAADLPLFVVLVGRPELEQSLESWWPATRQVTKVELLPISDAESQQLVRQLLSAAPADTTDELVARAGGNPFFLTELACAVRDTGRSTAELPDTVQASIAARLDMLVPPARRLLQQGAVLGQSFSPELVRALGGDVAPEVVAEVRRLDLLVGDSGGDDSLSFRHGLIRDVVYGQLTRSVRVDLHERAARYLVGTGQRVHVEAAAEHLLHVAELAPSPERSAEAAALLRQAAASAVGRGSGERAQEMLAAAARVVVDPLERVALLRDAAWLAYGRWHGDAAIALFDELADAAAAVGDAASECEASALAVEVRLRFSGTVRAPVDVKGLRDRMVRAQRCLPADDDRLAAVVATSRCWLDVRDGGLDETQIAQMLELARRSGDARTLSAALDTATAYEWSRGQLAAAAAIARERIEQIDRITNPAHVAIETTDALLMVADTALHLGDLHTYRTMGQRVFDVEVARGNSLAGRVRLIFAWFLLGDWGRLFDEASTLRDDWAAVGRPAASYASPAAWACVAVCRLRGDGVGAESWQRFVDQLIPVDSEMKRVWRTVLLADADIHLGKVQAAFERVAAQPPAVNGELNPMLAALRADAAAAASVPDAREVLAASAAVVEANRLAHGIWLRAAGRLGDRDALQESFEELRDIGAGYQAARTGVLLGGAAADEAAQVFHRLRVPPPGG